jgi:NRAMP (natural resistance-associated macrophage protein)-like metal ion transporter
MRVPRKPQRRYRRRKRSDASPERQTGRVAEPERVEELEREQNPFKRFAKLLGPGLVTGASDDDPSGIATYAMAGASLGVATLWTALVTFPLMAAVQSISARLALVSGQGLTGILRKRSPRLVYVAVFMLVVANTINVGADLAAIADAIGLLTGVHVPWLVVPLAVAVLAVQVLGSYRLLASVLKWLCLVLFAYVIDVFIVNPPVGKTLRATVLPTILHSRAYFTTLVAILGTTISPYLFFWQTTQEVEEKRAQGKTSLIARQGTTTREIHYSTIDVNVGMALSNLVMYSIILATATTLFQAGQHDIQTGADAARALKPLAGDFAEVLFAAGMIGTGLLAVPVLSGSAGHAVAELFDWRAGFDTSWQRAKPFYAVIIAITLVGAALTFSGIKPMAALYWTAVLNGVLAPPLLVLIMLAARDRRVMGEHPIGPVLTTFGWAATGGMFLALLGLLYSSLV